MPTKCEIKINALAVVQVFGGPTEVRFCLERHNLGSLSQDAISKWIERGRIPGEWLLSIMILARVLRVAFNPLMFVDKTGLDPAVRKKLKADAVRV